MLSENHPINQNFGVFYMHINRHLIFFLVSLNDVLNYLKAVAAKIGFNPYIINIVDKFKTPLNNSTLFNSILNLVKFIKWAYFSVIHLYNST